MLRFDRDFVDLGKSLTTLLTAHRKCNRDSTNRVRLTRVPSNFHYIINALVTEFNVTAKRKTSRSEVIACCAAEGMKIIAKHEGAQEICRINSELYTPSNWASVAIAEDVSLIMSYFPVQLRNTGSSNRDNSFSISLSSRQYDWLSTEAERLCVSTNALIQFAAAVAIIKLDDAISEHHLAQLESATQEFFSSVEKRILYGRKLLELQTVC